MSDSENRDNGEAGLPDLFRLATKRWRLIAGFASGFLVIAVIGTILRQPHFEATAFLEVKDEGEIATMQDRLKFPSLYRQVCETDDAARHLAKRVRIRASRGSRIVGVTVTHTEPTIAAEEANRVAEAFLETQPPPDTSNNAKADLERMRVLLEAVESLPDSEAPDSPEFLASTWRSQNTELEKLAERYEFEHPVRAGARERLEKLEKRIREQMAASRSQLGLRDPDDDYGDFGQQIESFLSEIKTARSRRDLVKSQVKTLENQIERVATPSDRVALAEPASAPLAPTGLPSLFIWFGALALGAFAGFLFALCRPA